MEKVSALGEKALAICSNSVALNDREMQSWVNVSADRQFPPIIHPASAPTDRALAEQRLKSTTIFFFKMTVSQSGWMAT